MKTDTVMNTETASMPINLDSIDPQQMPLCFRFMSKTDQAEWLRQNADRLHRQHGRSLDQLPEHEQHAWIDHTEETVEQLRQRAVIKPERRDLPDRMRTFLAPLPPGCRVDLRTPAPALYRLWMRQTINPHAFVTIVLPRANQPESGIGDKKLPATAPASHYLSLWTRIAECSLWGNSTLHVDNYQDRCLWFFVKETILKRGNHGTQDGLPHYHGLLRFPARPMLAERRLRRPLTDAERCQRMQVALINASKKTPEPYSSFRTMTHGADIDVRPYRDDDSGSSHATYMFKQLRAKHSDRWDDHAVGSVIQDHGLIILPHLPPKKKETK